MSDKDVAKLLRRIRELGRQQGKPGRWPWDEKPDKPGSWDEKPDMPGRSWDEVPESRRRRH